jgi:hypothetical protein
LVESGKMKSGQYGIGKNFGYTCDKYNENGFINYAKTISIDETHNGGLYMPLLIRKTDFMKIGGYPEGNIKIDSDIYNPVYAVPGEKLISGDKILMKKLANIGIEHKTVFNSIVYHFQAGELHDNVIDNEILINTNNLIICNDYISGRNGEKVLWQYLIELASNIIGIDMDIFKVPRKKFELHASNYISNKYKNSSMILQNASFLGEIKFNGHKITYLQDNFRQLNYSLIEQINNLNTSDAIFTNSVITASWYPDYNMYIVPIGVDTNIFYPKNKRKLRKQYNFTKYKTIGIFVENFSPVKGWNEIYTILKKRVDIFWIIVSKTSKDTINDINAKVYNKIDQQLLSDLLNCADFFIIGSKMETQCLAAIEACFCNIPIIMKNTGIFHSFNEMDKKLIGEISDNLETNIDIVINNIDKYSPNKIINKYNLDKKSAYNKWMWYLSLEQLKYDKKNIN